MNFLFRLLFQFSILGCTLMSNVDPNKCITWGPGLSPTTIVMPARYFFVQLYDEQGRKISRSPGEGLDVYVGGPKASSCRVWVNTLDRKDGSFIILYKLYHTCHNMKIDLRYNNVPLNGFPLKFEEPVLSDECNCPSRLNTWLNNMQCKKIYKQIEADLSIFKTVNFNNSRDDIISTYNRPNSVSLCHYVVKNNEIYRTCYGQYVGFKMFMDSILLSLARKLYLPDTEFFVNLGDWPLVRITDLLIPIFSWCGSEDTVDIVMPTYDLTESTLECMGRVQLDMLSVQGNTGPLWDDKVQKAFWRGRDARQERLDLIKISRQYPDLFNSSLTNFFFFRDFENEYGPKEPYISFFDFFQYKYQINIDGTVAAYRFPYLLAGDAVVLKQDSPYYEHFYSDLVRDVHYVPFKRDLSDLVEKVEWLRTHDRTAREISIQAQSYARENLLPKDIFCYYAVLLKEWSSRLSSKPEILPGMEHVKQDESDCPCPILRENIHEEL